MNMHLTLLAILLATSTIGISCKKEKEVQAPDPVVPTAPASPTYSTANSDFFKNQRWAWSPRKDEIHVTSKRLTQDAIDKGVSVYVACYSDFDDFEKIPAQLGGFNLSYVVEPEHLYVINKLPYVQSNMYGTSDIRIEY